MPKFSIVTATYNSKDDLVRTAASVKAQTFQDFEWLIFDGASTDGTLGEIQLIEPLLCYWESVKDKGIADAWNKALTKVRGEYVLVLNAGDTYDPHFLATISKHCDGKRIVCSHARLKSASGIDCGVFLAQPEKLNRAMHVPHNWCAVPRHHYEDLGGYRHLPLAMDFDWFHRYYKLYGVSGFTVINQVMGTYHLGGKSDVDFRRSFRANEQILIENGMSSAAAKVHRLLYSFKHLLKRWVAVRG